MYAGMLVAFAAVAALLSASVMHFSYTDKQTSIVSAEVNQAFTAWRQQFRKVYISPSELNYRLKNFAFNLQFIKESNADKSNSYTLGLNKFSDLTEEEFVAKYTGLKLADPTGAVPHVNQGVVNLEVDWRTRGVVNDIKDQMQCGASWAFAAVGAIESAWVIRGRGSL